MARVQDEFGILLDKFDATIEGYPKIGKVTESLKELKIESLVKSDLTERQKGAIHGRCDNYLKGDYGDQRKNKDSRSDFQKKLN